MDELALSQAVDSLIAYWRRQGVPLQLPATDDEIFSTFQDCGRPATAEVLYLYRQLNGFADGTYCQNHWSLWSLAKIRDENRFNPSQDVWFADYLIDSYYFSLHAEDSHTTSVHVQSHYKSEIDSFKVAETVTDFLQKLLSHPESVEVFPLSEQGVGEATLLQRARRWWKPWS
jgi:hypothetical protein